MDDILLSRAFDVEEISPDFDPTVPPSTGHEYLQYVMYEASKCPQIMVADIDRQKIKNQVNINLGLCNSKNKDSDQLTDWQNQQIAIFSDLRRKVQMSKKSSKFKPLSLPKVDNVEKWYGICFGDKNLRLEPSLTLLLSMNEPMLERILEYQLEWLEDGLRPNQGKWLYALLACLGLPLTPLTCSVLRDVARLCVKIKCSESSLEKNDVTTLNVITCLISNYFGQKDLTDE